MKRRTQRKIDKSEARVEVLSHEESVLRDSQALLILADDVDLEEISKQVASDFEKSLKKTAKGLIVLLILVSSASIAVAESSKTMEEPSLERLLPAPKRDQQFIQENVEPEASEWQKWQFDIQFEIYRRIKTGCEKAHLSLYPALRASTSFRVTRDGRVLHTKLVDPSSNAEFNSLVIESTRSMNGNALLQFPGLSTRTFIDMTGAFAWQNTPHPICREIPVKQPQPTKQTRILIRE